MSFKVLLHPKAARFLKKLDPYLRKRITERLHDLEEFPDRRGERLLRSQFWKLGVGDYRAIYEIDRAESRVIVLFVGHRKDVYDDFSRLF